MTNEMAAGGLDVFSQVAESFRLRGSVSGTFAGLEDDVPELSATSIVEIPPPEDPYE